MNKQYNVQLTSSWFNKLVAAIPGINEIFTKKVKLIVRIKDFDTQAEKRRSEAIVRIPRWWGKNIAVNTNIDPVCKNEMIEICMYEQNSDKDLVIWTYNKDRECRTWTDFIVQRKGKGFKMDVAYAA